MKIMIYLLETLSQVQLISTFLYFFNWLNGEKIIVWRFLIALTRLQLGTASFRKWKTWKKDYYEKENKKLSMAYLIPILGFRIFLTLISTPLSMWVLPLEIFFQYVRIPSKLQKLVIYNLKMEIVNFSEKLC